MLKTIHLLEFMAKIKLDTAERLLLAETGTLEQILSILLASDIKVHVTFQMTDGLEITRHTSLYSDMSDIILVHAVSKIKIDCFNTSIISAILEKKIGLGRIISNYQLETFRKIEVIGYEPVRDSIFRKYNIIHLNKPAIHITECFTVQLRNKLRKIKTA